MGIYVNNNPFILIAIVMGFLALYTLAVYVAEWVQYGKVQYSNTPVVDNPIHWAQCPRIHNTDATCYCVVPYVGLKGETKAHYADCPSLIGGFCMCDIG